MTMQGRIRDESGSTVKPIGLIGWSLGIFGVACKLDTPPTESPLPMEPLDLAEALVLIVQPGDTLSELAQLCAIKGGAATLASWNSIDNLDRIDAHTPLLLPEGTRCDRPLTPARLPRFDETWSTCKLDWQALQYDPLDAYGGLTQAEVDAMEGTREGGRKLDQMERQHSRCADVGKGVTVCWRPRSAPGLEVRQGDTVLYTNPRHHGYGGSAGGLPQLAWHDLDGDGDEELVLTKLIGWSNGISIPSSTILVFEDEHSEPYRQGSIFDHPDHWIVNDQGGCDFLWVDITRLSGPVLGAGNYYIGVRHRWTGEALAPVGDTFAAQRLLERFFARAKQEQWGDKSALVWLLNDEAEARPLSELPDRP